MRVVENLYLPRSNQTIELLFILCVLIDPQDILIVPNENCKTDFIAQIEMVVLNLTAQRMVLKAFNLLHTKSTKQIVCATLQGFHNN